MTSGPSGGDFGDPSNGYDSIAQDFMAVRSTSGREVVRRWAASLPRSCSVVDIGAGYGDPLTSVLIDQGLSVMAIDASPRLVAAFRHRHPGVEIACERAERSRFFGRTFDAALAVGLIFLLSPDDQRELVRRTAQALTPGGRWLFSAPRQAAAWTDILTGRASRSLGAEKYERVLAHSGLRIIDEQVDEGGARYYDTRKETPE